MRIILVIAYAIQSLLFSIVGPYIQELYGLYTKLYGNTLSHAFAYLRKSHILNTQGIQSNMNHFEINPVQILTAPSVWAGSSNISTLAAFFSLRTAAEI